MLALALSCLTLTPALGGIGIIVFLILRKKKPWGLILLSSLPIVTRVVQGQGLIPRPSDPEAHSALPHCTIILELPLMATILEGL